MANIQNELNNIKNALFGQEVRGSIHDGIDAINKEVESTTSRQVDLESTFDQLVINAGNSNAEIVDARVKADGTSYSKLGDRLDSVDSQLEHIENSIDITPDNFTGNDSEKLKKAIEYCYNNNISNLFLNRVYDVTGHTVTLDNYGIITISGGGIRKNDEGFVFTNSLNGLKQSPNFLNTAFYSTIDDNKSILIDGNKLIRTRIVNCLFDGMGLIKADGYIQSVRVTNSWTGYLSARFIECSSLYDVDLCNNTFEASNLSLIKMIDVNNGNGAISNLRICNNVIEGYGSETPIDIIGGYGINISDNYFEQNNVDINVNSTGAKIIVGEIINNRTEKVKGSYSINIESSVNANKLIIDNNCMIGVDSNTCLVNRNLLPFNFGRNIVNQGKYIPDNFIKKYQNTSMPVEIEDTGTSIKFKFKLPIENYGSLIKTPNMYLLYIKGCYGGSEGTSQNVNYIDNCLFAISISGVMNTGTIKAKINITPIININTDISRCSCTFDSSGTDISVTTSTQETVTVEIQNYKNASECYASLKMFDGILNNYYMN